MNKEEKQMRLMIEFNLIGSPVHITYWDMKSEEHIEDLKGAIRYTKIRLRELSDLIEIVKVFENAGGVIGRKIGNHRIMNVKQVGKLIVMETKNLNYLTRQLEKAQTRN